MGKATGRARVERHLANMSPPMVDATWSPPPLADCEPQETWEIPLDVTNHVVVRVVFHHGAVVDFAMMLRTNVGGDWVEVARIDCCHGIAHKHQFHADGSSEDWVDLLPIRSRGDVAHAYDEATTMIMDDYREHLRRWERVW